MHCPQCGLDPDLGPESDARSCPHCGAPLAPPSPSTDLVIDVRARTEDATPLHDTNSSTEPLKAQPVFEEHTFQGRAWPGGPQVFGRTFVFQSGSPINPNQGRGCCACGCLVLLLLGYIFLEGLRALF